MYELDVKLVMRLSDIGVHVSLITYACCEPVIKFENIERTVCGLLRVLKVSEYKQSLKHCDIEVSVVTAAYYRRK